MKTEPQANQEEVTDMLTELKARLGTELDRLAQELTGVGPGRGEETDGRPGAEAARRNELQRNVRYLGQLVAGLASADGSTIWPERAGFGSTVVLRDLASGEELAYTLVTGETIDLDAGQVSLASPVGQALLGGRRGDEVSVRTPHGARRFRILSLVTLPQRLGITASQADADPAHASQLS